MTKLKFTQYTPSQNGTRTIEEACSEIQREMDVRKRLFDKWVLEGRMSWVEAHDRLERLCSALRYLITYSNEIDQAEPDQDSTISTPLSSSSLSMLDTDQAAAAA